MVNLWGVVNLYKAKGLTSFEATQSVKNVLGARKAGHGGTLDPEAEGVLPVLVGKATRISSLFLGSEKVYRVALAFGIKTDTYDMAGEVTGRMDDFTLSLDRLEKDLESFVGTYLQVPPRYSAVKVKGKRAYSLARKGEDFQLSPRMVTCRKVELLDFSGDEVEIRISCKSGFYIRSMARDLGERIGIPSTAKRILRERTGGLHISGSLYMEDLERFKVGDNIEEGILSVDEALPDMQSIFVDERCENFVRKGKRPEEFLPVDPPPGRYKIKTHGGEVIAIVEKNGKGGLGYFCVFP